MSAPQTQPPGTDGGTPAAGAQPTSTPAPAAGAAAPSGGKPGEGAAAAPAAGAQDPGGQPAAGKEGAAAPAEPSKKTAQLGQLGEDDGMEGEPKGSDAPPADFTPKLPEGVEDTALVEALKATKGDPQKVVDALFAHQKAKAEASAAEWTQTRQSWLETLKADKDFGGAKFAESIKAAELALAECGDQEVIDWIRESELNVFPPLLKLLRNFGARLKPKEGSVAGGQGAAPPPKKSDLDLAREWYPNTKHPEFEQQGR